MATFTIIHWLASQGFSYYFGFPYDIYDKPVYSELSDYAFVRPTYFLYVVLIGSSLSALLLILAIQRMRSSIPLAGSCSAAISAACHPPDDVCKDTAAHGKLMWGETVFPIGWSDQDSLRDNEKGHCSFVPFEARRPSLSKLYC